MITHRSYVMQNEIAQMRIVSDLRCLSDVYTCTGTLVEPAEVAALLNQQADLLERTVLYRA